MADLDENASQNAIGSAGRPEDPTSRRKLASVSVLTIYVCAAIGGMIAAIADIVQKEQASAVIKISSISARHLNLQVQPLYVLGLVVLLGVLLCFVFQPGNRRAGFAVGAGVIASIMTVTPFQSRQTGQPAETVAPPPGQTESGGLLPRSGSDIRIASADQGFLQLAMDVRDVAVISVKNDLPIPVEVKMSFFDRNGGQPFEQMLAIAAGATSWFEFTAAATQGTINGEYYLEVAGERSKFLTASGRPPYYSDPVLLTQAIPSFAQSQINQDALRQFTASGNDLGRPASDAEIRQIYSKPSGFFDRLQQRLTTPQRW